MSSGGHEQATKDGELDCEHTLAKVYEFLDHEIDSASDEAIREHLTSCEPCLDKFDLEQSVKALVNRCCGGDKAPETLRAKVLGALSAVQERAAEA